MSVEKSVLSPPLSYEYVFKCRVFFYILAFVYGIYFCIVSKLRLGYITLQRRGWGLLALLLSIRVKTRVQKQPWTHFLLTFRVWSSTTSHPALRRPFEPPLQPSHLAARAW